MQFKEQQHQQEMQQKDRQFNAQLETDSVLQNAKQSADLELENKRIDNEAQAQADSGDGGEAMTKAMAQLGEGIAAMAAALAEFKNVASQLGKRVPMKHIRDPQTGRISHSVPMDQ